jgi:hypothetical protein
MSMVVNVRTLPAPRGRPLSSSLSHGRIYAGYWDPASADWRIYPTSFEPRQRAGDGRLGSAHLRCHGPAPLALRTAEAMQPGTPGTGKTAVGEMPQQSDQITKDRD